MLVDDGKDFALPVCDFSLQIDLNIGRGFFRGKPARFCQLFETLALIRGGSLMLLALRYQLGKSIDDVAIASRLPPHWRPPTPPLFGGGQRSNQGDLLI